jgi:hypothetical protein
MNGVRGIKWIQVQILTRVWNYSKMNGDDDDDRCAKELVQAVMV